MATEITQKPLYRALPVEQDVIFTLTNTGIVNSMFNVKFIAEVYISTANAGGQKFASTSVDNLVGTFKTTPNSAGVGIFDFSPVIATKVKADNMSGVLSSYKGTVVNPGDTPFPIHIIDKFSSNVNSLSWMIIKFFVEGSTTATGIPTIQTDQNEQSVSYEIFNGYLKYTDKLDIFEDNFGFKISTFYPDANTKSLLTNAPTTQYANVVDYGTVAFLNPTARVDNIKINYYNDAGSLGSDTVDTNIISSFISDAQYRLLFFGCFPGNLNNWSSTFTTAVGLGLTYYTVRLFDNTGAAISKTYTININCPTLKGYEPIRLAWLNQWGAWDYYTFTLKSTKTTSTQGSTFNQLEGTWNESAFRLDSYKGGKKTFRVNATEKISMNTDYVNESESEWFEELINSPEIYILDGYQNDLTLAMLNTYVTPVRLTTSSYTKKTIANDKLMQYTFEVEKTKTLRTQAV